MLKTFLKHHLFEQAIDVLFGNVIVNFVNTSIDHSRLKKGNYVNKIQTVNYFGEITYLGCTVRFADHEIVVVDVKTVFHGNHLQYGIKDYLRVGILIHRNEIVYLD